MQIISSPEIWSSLELGGIDLYAAEENATFWLWAYPSLLGWHRKLEWLFSPVVGNSQFPGDLWGIDEAGNLLLVEMKRKRQSDPFKDFIGYENNKIWELSASYEQLKKRWEKLYSAELDFWQSHATELNKRQLGKITAKGVVPYSSKRIATRQWIELYTKVIIPHLFEEAAYSKNVIQFLKVRNQLVEKTIYYFGMVFVKDPNQLNLSKKGEDHFRELSTRTGNDRVHLLSMVAQKSQSDQCVHLQCSISTLFPS
jgi:hypothetical protein